MKKQSMHELLTSSYLSGSSQAYIESLYESFLADASSVSDEWRDFFAKLPPVNGMAVERSHEAVVEQFKRLAISGRQALPAAQAMDDQQYRFNDLKQAYRRFGHLHAQLDPLQLQIQAEVPELSLSYHGLNEQTLTAEQQAELQTLQQTYCQHIGFEYAYVTNREEYQWLQQRIEQSQAKPNFDTDLKKIILRLLGEAEGLEKYLGNKYVGQKRFSLEGGDSLIPLLNHLVHRAGSNATKEIVIGVAHRGRLNVLVNVFGKSPAELFSEFEGKLVDAKRSGDVKYHLGFSSDIETAGGPVHLALAFNPSHLAIISPVVEGSVRARQERRNDHQREQVLPILIHGDAAFAGQGVIMEIINMSQVRGFKTGGTVHIVVNNQVGFTTSNPQDSRSTHYCSDLMKMIEAPVLHVNGDDPEAVLLASEIALDYRHTFQKDVLIDLVCYRRHGHNEADEPSGTQPKMYSIIKDHPTTYKLYADKLQQQGLVSATDIQKISDEYREILDSGQPVITMAKDPDKTHLVNWEPYLDQAWDQDCNTAITAKALTTLANKLTSIPADFTLQAQVAREIKNRQAMTHGELPLNWGYGETMAYASLLADGVSIRLCGQDSGRGTFSHRHAVLHDFNNAHTYIPLQHVAKQQGQFAVIDSILSEEAVLAYEYGYATANPDGLVIWEAQFGDFANGAQVVIDQFLSSGEQKWGRLCGLVLLLPHGYEGMGPEHSSARLERYLQLCAQENMQICVPTTPAQAFHMLRRQVLRPYRKPLIVMSPKSLLRHKQAISSLDDLTQGHFHLVIPEVAALNASKVKKLIFCSGKVYYDLVAKRDELAREDVAIIRIEQLYPFPEQDVAAQLATYSQAKTVVWCQEEPKNQGAWYFMRPNLEDVLTHQQLHYAGRLGSASPAAGSAQVHHKEQAQLVDDAFNA